jgi:hypothetical protein
MIQKLKGRVKGGSMVVCLAAKKCARVIQKSRACSLCVFFLYIRGVVHYEFIPQGQTVNAAFYMEVLKHLHECVQGVRPELWAEKNWILHHDNAPLHSARIVCEFFLQKRHDYHGSPFLFTQFDTLHLFFVP